MSNTTQQTPAQRAEAALSSSDVFCRLLAEARTCRVDGWWDGSAFRCHPCGLIAGTIKLTNHWHVDDLCDIYLTDGDGWNRSVSQDSFGHNSPHPSPINGAAVRAWRCGQWASPEIEAAIRPRVLEILTSAAEAIQRKRAADKAADEQSQKAAQERQQERLAAALAKAAA